MKTKDEVLDAIRHGKESLCLDGRDFARLARFMTVEEMAILGYAPTDDALETWKPHPWTVEHVIVQLRDDVAFGFEKALDQRGISASLMYEVVKLWLWILDDPLQYQETYPMYGLPLFKAVAEKYGFENPIGADSGSKAKYEES